MREIRIYGALAKFLKRRVFRAEVATAAEAVRFLVANFPAVEKHMADQHYRVSLSERDLSLDEIHEPAGQQVIKIAPVMAGAGGPTERILAGVALVALSFLLPGIGLVAGLTLNAVLFSAGASLVVGGVAQLLSPVPTATTTGADSNNDPRKSYSFSSIQNTSRQGTPVPICYGEIITGSIVISAGIDVAQVAG